MYLELQRNAVLDALTKAGEGPAAVDAPPSTPTPDPSSLPKNGTRRSTKPFKLERRRTPDGPMPTTVHTADCDMAGDLAHAVNATEARLAITDAGLHVCGFCTPDVELGLDVD